MERDCCMCLYWSEWCDLNARLPEPLCQKKDLHFQQPKADLEFYIHRHFYSVILTNQVPYQAGPHPDIMVVHLGIGPRLLRL